jgi:antitoxin component of MazEF toxin-antitoxin module
MTKTITKVGNSQGLMFDSALMEMARLKVGDQVRITVHEGGSIVLTPLRPRVSRAKVSRAIKATMKDYARTMKRLA